MSNPQNSIQRAYDAAVDPEGYPTERAQELLKSHDGLIGEAYGAAMWIAASHEDLSAVDVFLAAFTTALIWQQNREVQP